MGSGKSGVGVRLIEELEGLPALIVCPAVVIHHWQTEIEKFWKGEVPLIQQYKGKATKRRKLSASQGIMIVNYELFSKDFDVYFSKQTFKMTLFDETHRLKNVNTKVTQCAYQLKTEYIHLLSGTPITKQFDDVFSYLHLLFPKQFKENDFWRFRYKYGDVINNGYGAELVGFKKGGAEQLGKLLKQFTVRHLKKEVLSQLPAKTYQTIYVDLLPEQERLYSELLEYMYAELDNDSIVEASSMIGLMMKLRQVTLSSQLVGGEKAHSAKADALLDLLKDRKLAGKQTVIMSDFRTWVDIVENALKNKGFKTVRITGKETSKQKQESITSFQSGQADVALCTIKAAGTGITLTAADMLIFTDISWTDVDNRQAEDRIHRVSQTQNVQIVKLFAKHTIDEVILNKTLLKAISAKQLLDPSEKEEIKNLLKEVNPRKAKLSLK